MNIISTNLDENAWQTRMAAGELGDLVIFGDMGDHLISAMNANLLLDWNELDMTPYVNIESYTKDAQTKLSKFVMDATDIDGVWGFGHDIGYNRPTGTSSSSPTTACRSAGTRMSQPECPRWIP